MSARTRARRTGQSILTGLVVALFTAAVWWTSTGQGADTQTARDTSSTGQSSSPAGTGADAGGDRTDPDSGLPVVDVADLPAEAAETLRLIDDGGPFPEDEDGSVFQNREELLPDRDEGYYREYTVPTPGSDDRGARRIVTGSQGEYYWTDDHYSSFSRIARFSRMVE